MTQDDLVIDRIVKEGVSADHIDLITIALDTSLNESLILEGIARELKNKINTMRKDQSFAVTDRVHLCIDTTSDIIKAFETHKDYIMSEVLALSVEFKPCKGVAWDINGEQAIIEVNKA